MLRSTNESDFRCYLLLVIFWRLSTIYVCSVLCTEFAVSKHMKMTLTSTYFLSSPQTTRTLLYSILLPFTLASEMHPCAFIASKRFGWFVCCCIFFSCGEPTVIAKCYTHRRHVEIKGPIVFSNHLFILQMEGKHTFGWDERWTHQTFDINENRVWVVYWILREWRMNMVWSWPWAHCINGRRTVCICICVCSMTHDMDLYGEVIRWHGNVSGVRT